MLLTHELDRVFISVELVFATFLLCEDKYSYMSVWAGLAKPFFETKPTSMFVLYLLLN